MHPKLSLLLALLLVGIISTDAMFRGLPWVLKRLFANELIDYYNSINQEEEKTLLKVFIMARGDPDRAEELVRQLDPNLYKSYSQVFPPYYSKLNGLSPETYKFYKHTVLDRVKALIRGNAYQRDVFKHFAIIDAEWEKLSEESKAELARAFPGVATYLDSTEFKSRAKLGADYD